ncbi:hypothetical protein PENSUB_970 [Penicillium subrubescens]|uniref:FAD/NAD(P)-binding domain-containing protein n=1 Tax=Penicillium subrubescens TaxID=1316194 RepID=A0A1Q5ULJ7_9EURO|nr:hypothetical protein PENSUB_970 [Penicillium subrubescens]
MAIGNDASPSKDGYPPRGDLREMMDQNSLPMLAPGLIDPASMTGDAATKQAQLVLSTFNSAAAANNYELLASCFFEGQAYWKDQLALTYHLRTFKSAGVIAASLLETKALRNIKELITVDGAAMFLPATPVLQFIDCPISLRTELPAATCKGKMLLLPAQVDPKNESSAIQWKIWILSTRVVSLDVQTENEDLLQSPGRQLEDLIDFETDVWEIKFQSPAGLHTAVSKQLVLATGIGSQKPNLPDIGYRNLYQGMSLHSAQYKNAQVLKEKGANLGEYSSDPTQSLMHNLLERAGGHYVDVGGTKLIAEGKVGIKAGAKPVAYTTTGLRFSDGITLDADAVVWCTGFADSNVRETAVQILGGNLQRDNGSTRQARSVLGAQEIAERLEGTWGIDGEGRFVFVPAYKELIDPA